VPPEYRPVSASQHVAPEQAVPENADASSAGASDASADDASSEQDTTAGSRDDAGRDDAGHDDSGRDAGTAGGASAAGAAAGASANGSPLADAPREPTDHHDDANANATGTDAQTTAAPTTEAPTRATTVTPTPTPYAGATYLNAPAPPKKRGNRSLGILIAILGALIFAALNAAVTFGILSLDYGFSRAQTYLTSYLKGWEFWVPVGVFTLAFIALVAIVNRGRWWAYIFGSMFVSALVFVAYFGAALLTNRVWERTPGEFRTFTDAYFGTNIPYLWVAVAASFIALEVVVWIGGWISFHGQHAKRRYLEAKAAYDAEYSTERAER